MNRTIGTQIKSNPGKSASRFLAKQRIKKNENTRILGQKKNVLAPVTFLSQHSALLWR